MHFNYSSLCLASSYCRAPKHEANKRRTGEVLFDLGARTYVYLSVTLGKDRHIHTVTLDRHIHIRIYEMETALERRRRLARERVLQNISGRRLLLQFV